MFCQNMNFQNNTHIYTYKEQPSHPQKMSSSSNKRSSENTIRKTCGLLCLTISSDPFNLSPTEARPSWISHCHILASSLHPGCLKTDLQPPAQSAWKSRFMKHRAWVNKSNYDTEASTCLRRLIIFHSVSVSRKTSCTKKIECIFHIDLHILHYAACCCFVDAQVDNFVSR